MYAVFADNFVFQGVCSNETHIFAKRFIPFVKSNDDKDRGHA